MINLNIVYGNWADLMFVGVVPPIDINMGSLSLLDPEYFTNPSILTSSE